jgi:hypothetical protein
MDATWTITETRRDMMKLSQIPSLEMDVGMPSSRTQNTLLEPVTLAILIAIAILDAEQVARA